MKIHHGSYYLSAYSTTSLKPGLLHAHESVKNLCLERVVKSCCNLVVEGLQENEITEEDSKVSTTLGK